MQDIATNSRKAVTRRGVISCDDISGVTPTVIRASEADAQVGSAGWPQLRQTSVYGGLHSLQDMHDQLLSGIAVSKSVYTGKVGRITIDIDDALNGLLSSLF